MIEAETVTMRCSRKVERTRNPEPAKSALPGSSSKSVGSNWGGTELVIKASTTWRWAPTASVRQTAGLTLLPKRSSNGNGTRMTLYRIAEGFAVGDGVDVLRRVGEKREGVAGRRRPQPGILGISVGGGGQHCHHEARVRGQVVRLIENNLFAIEMGLKCYRRHVGRIPVVTVQSKYRGTARRIE